MRKLVWVVLCSVGLGPVSIGAQPASSAETALRDSLVKSSFILRNFSADAEVHAEWNGTELTLDSPRWRTMGVLKIKSVKLKGQQVRINGIRRTLLYDKKGQLTLYRSEPPEVEIVVDLHAADPNMVLPQLENELFFPSLGDAVAAVPKQLQGSIPGHILTEWRPKKQSPPCDCAADGTDACVDHRLNGLQQPKVLRSVDPEFTDEARRAKLNGNVQVALTVDSLGHPMDLWLVRPLGYGLDEAAARAVQQYIFQPATCHDNAVPVTLYIDVNFQIY